MNAGKMFLIVITVFCAAAAFLPPEVLAAPAYEEQILKGERFYEEGRFEQAVQAWEAALESMPARLLPTVYFDTVMHLASAYQSLGYQKKALTLLRESMTVFSKSRDPRRNALFLNLLSDIYLSVGMIKEAVPVLENALNQARQSGDPHVLAIVLNNAGNVLAIDGDAESALAAYAECLENIKSPGGGLDSETLEQLKTNALINIARAQFLTGEYPDILAAVDAAVQQLETLPESAETASDWITLGMLCQSILKEFPNASDRLIPLAHQAFDSARQTAEKIKNDRLSSYALGYLAQIYEIRKEYEKSLEMTRRALFLAQKENAAEAMYLWHWQTGRLLKSLGNFQAAIKAYRQSIYTLTPIRSELFRGYRGDTDVFGQLIKPVYLGLAELLLMESRELKNENLAGQKINEAIDAVELLKTAEFQDYFQDECVTAAQLRTKRIEKMPPHTALVYPVLFEDHLVLILNLPDSLKQKKISVDKDRFTETVLRFRRSLQTRQNNRFLRDSWQLYDWMIRPIADDLKSHEIDTLIFAPDGPMKLIPLSTLNDGQQFLVEQYAIGTIPALSLTEPKSGRNEESRILIAGLSESVQGASPLPSVPAELRDIRQIMDGQIVLQDKTYTLGNLDNQLKNSEYNMVHLATHGVFGGNPEETFLLTYDGKLNMNRLEEIISYSQMRKKQVELLTLSACQTALGDERAALGLAGVAVKAGVGSAVATLWFVDDEATSIALREFYRQLRKPGMTKAKAMQNAQKDLLKQLRFQHPAYWGPFLIIGNWM